MSGKVLQLRQFWKISERDLTRAESKWWKSWNEILDSDESLELVLYIWITRITVLLANVIHCKAKKLLKRSAFCLKSVIKARLCLRKVLLN